MFGLKKIIGSSFSRDIFYVLIAQIVIMVSVFGINKIIGVYIGVVGFGVFSLIKRAGSLLSCVQRGGMNIALPRYVARFSNSSFTNVINRSLLQTSLIIVGGYTLLTIILFLLFPSTFSSLLFQNEDIEVLLIVATFIFAFGQTYSNLIYSYYQGKGDFKKYNIVQIICSLLCLVVTFLFRSSVSNLVIASYALLSLLSIFFIFVEYYRLRQYSIRKVLLKKSIATMFSYGGSRMGYDLVSLLQDILPLSIILARFSIESVGLYSAALSIPLAISPLFAFTGGVFLQRISLLYKEHNMKAIEKIINIALSLFVGIALLGSIALIVLRRPLMHLFYSTDFDEAIGMSVFFSMTLIPRAIYLLYRNPLDAISSKPYNLIVVVVSTIVLVILLLFATSLMQCAIAYLFSSLVMAILSLIFWRVQMKKTKYMLEN